MQAIRSRGYRRGAAIVWELDANQFELTPTEFQELMRGIRDVGLFAQLDAERPALLSQLRDLFALDCKDPEEEKELEQFLEQTLLGLEQSLPPET